MGIENYCFGGDLFLCVFTFTWSVRQYNFCSVLVGSAPLATERGIEDSERELYAMHMAQICSLAANQFNYGLRAFILRWRFVVGFLVHTFVWPPVSWWWRYCIVVNSVLKHSKH